MARARACARVPAERTVVRTQEAPESARCLGTASAAAAAAAASVHLLRDVFLKRVQLTLLLLVFLGLIAGDESKEPSPVCAFHLPQTKQAGAWALICGVLRAWVLKGLDHPQAFKGFFGLN